MKWWGWVLVLLPAGVGIAISVLATKDVITNPVLFLRGSLSVLVAWCGVTLSLLALVAALIWNRDQASHAHKALAAQRQAIEERRRFLQRLDHELKNPLTAIRAGLTNIAYQPLDEYVTGEVSAVQAQALRISTLIADLRKLAALEVTPLDQTTVNMADLLKDVVAALADQEQAQDRQLSLIVPSAPWPLPHVTGDPDLLLLALHNLLDNALKFTAPGDTIEVRAAEDGRDILIEVADTGPGIPEVEIQRVWEELYRGERARGVPGSGLGLSLVRAIIEKHGGRVALRSRPGQGSVFSIRLPAE